MLVNQIERLSKSDARIVVLTSTEPSDDAIVDVCEKNGYQYFRGDLNDVLKRFVDCGNYFGLSDYDDYIFRVTGDCPLVNHESINDFIAERGFYLSPLRQCAVDGLDVEMVRFIDLKFLNLILDKCDPQREHVLSAITKRDTQVWVSLRNKRLSVDTQEDFDLIEKIYNHFGRNDFTIGDLVKYFETN